MRRDRPEGDGAQTAVERSYEAISRSPGICMVVLGADATVLSVNATLASLLGRAPEQLVGRSVLEFTHPEDCETTLAAIYRLRGGEDSARFAKRYLRADGSVLWAEVTVTAVRDEDGRLERAIGILEDSTERRRAEAALLDSQRDLVELMSTISDGLLILDYTGHILGANTSMATMLGREQGGLRGLSIADLCVPQDGRADAVELIRDMATGVTTSDTLRLRSADDSELPVEVRVTHGSWGGGLAMFAVCRDITERLRAEAELQASQRRLEGVFRASPNALVLSDPVTAEIVDANHAFEKMAGLPLAAMVGRYAWELGLSLDPMVRRKLMESARTDGPPPQIEFSTRKRDGAEISLLLSAHIVEIGGRELLLTVGTDITERKRNEESLRQSEEQYRQVVERSGEAIVILREGKVQYLNPWGETAVRLGPGEAIGVPALEFIHPEDRLRADGLLRSWEREGRDVAFELRVVGADGRTRWVRGTATTTRWQGERALLAFVQDITGLTEAERSAREATGRLRQIIDLVPMHISVHDAEGRYTLVNRAAAAFHGGTPQEIEGRTLMELGVAPEAAREILNAAKEAMGEGAPLSQPYTRVKDNEGVEHILDVTRVPLVTGDGRLGVLTVGVDITEMTRTQQELASAASQLRQTNQDLEQFAYVASHDLREPLRTVSYSLHLLRSNYPEAQEGGAGRYLNEALRGVQRMDRLIRELLEYSRSGRRMAPEPVDVGRALATAIASLGSLVSESAASITWDGLPEHTLFDPGQLSVVLQNLLSNAIRFHGNTPPRIHVWGEHGPAEWVIHVRDEGVGIDPHDHGRIFQMFQRAGSGRHPSGTGIGLAICARIVESHGGRIWVDSELGQGATFSFSAPYHPATQSDTAVTGSPDAQDPRILGGDI